MRLVDFPVPLPCLERACPEEGAGEVHIVTPLKQREAEQMVEDVARFGNTSRTHSVLEERGGTLRPLDVPPFMHSLDQEAATH